MNENTKFSILVVTLNAEKVIKNTLASILSQTYDNYEVIIKDGLSLDNTLEYLPADSRFYVIQKKDRSVYDGMNQAIDYIKGDYVLFLNAGDTFYDSKVLEKVNEFIINNKILKPVILYGDYANSKNKIIYQKRRLNSFFLYRRPLCHQSILYHQAIIKKERFNIEYKISADHELTLRLWKSNIPFIHLGYIICRYEGGGMSESIEGKQIAVYEKRCAIQKYYSKSEILKYDLIMQLSFSRIRGWILSDNSPACIRKLYYTIVNLLSK